MKKLITLLGVVSASFLTGCKDDQLTHSYVVSGKAYTHEISQLEREQKYHHNVEFQVHTELLERNYPGNAQPLPRMEVKKYNSGKIEANIYLAK